MHSLDVQPIDHFKKEAKRLTANVHAGSEAALARVSAVYRNAASLGSDVGLMRTQHVVAVESGFPSWDALLKAPAVELRLVITMSKIPELNDFGIGEFDGDLLLPRAERDAKFAKNRATLRTSTAPVARTVEWLRRNVAPTKTVSEKGTSYGFKHWLGRELGYVTNGVFIAAGVIAGYSYKIAEDSPNVQFGFSARSLRQIDARSHQPEKVLARTPDLALPMLRRNGVADAIASTVAPQVLWREGGELRGMKFSPFDVRPPLVAIDVDNFMPLVLARTMTALGVSNPSRRKFAHFEFTRRCAQRVVVTYDELEHGIAWALGGSAASGPPLDVEPTTEDPVCGRQTWSRRARAMWSLQRRT